MNEIRNDNTTLEAARSSSGNESLDVLLAGDAAALSQGGLTQTEAIILLRGRPALVIQDGAWEDPKSAEIRQRLAPAEAVLKATIPKVGRVEILDYRMDYVGTGWMIEEDVLITNRHVAELFGEKRGNLFSFRANAEGSLYKARVDFRREYQRSSISQAAIKDIIFIEEPSELRPDMALVRMDKSSGALPSPIELDSAVPSFRNNIAVIGYPAEDPRNDAFAMRDIFKGIYNVKRLSPGWVSGVRSDGKLLEHDCTTLGGNSGSVVMNLESGKACGLHFSGTYRDKNFAVTSAWLKARLAELGPVRVTMAAQSPVTERAEAGDAAATEGAPDLSVGREGYRSTFLGEGELEVGLPEIDPSLQAQIAPVTGADNGELKYTHFSIRMRADRRLPFYTACNIAGGLLFNFPRGTDRWFMDSRLSKQDHQIGQALYASNPLDRGHLVRRLDPAWGETRSEAKQAEEDTFFFTNCTPQHAKLNQKTWLSLEDYVLSNAGTHELKVTVFTGPIMRENDRNYRDVQIPEEFWKVVVVINAFTNQLSATGYVLSQADYLGDLEFLYGEFKTYQVPISQIEEKTKLSFNLSSFDPLSKTEARPQREVRGAEDIIL
jgi:endonuclease G